MAVTSAQKREALLAAKRLECEDLANHAVRICGNAFSPIVLVKGELNETERDGADVLSGADGVALRSALERLGYAPEDFCALSAVAGAGEEGVVATLAPGDPLPAELFRQAIEVLDPEAVVLLDEGAAAVMREAYAEELAAIEQFDVAMLMPGLVARVLGRRVLALGGFEAALGDAAAKQRVWAYLKQLPPLGSPF